MHVMSVNVVSMFIMLVNVNDMLCQSILMICFVGQRRRLMFMSVNVGDM